jgi:hypothetical protein
VHSQNLVGRVKRAPNQEAVIDEKRPVFSKVRNPLQKSALVRIFETTL